MFPVLLGLPDGASIRRFVHQKQPVDTGSSELKSIHRGLINALGQVICPFK
jgi:hypothetical protein